MLLVLDQRAGLYHHARASISRGPSV